MDLLQQPEVKSTYDKCKYVVKLWEHNFKKDQGRLPSKLDIRESDKKVRDAYRQYYQLKTAALEQSFKDVDGFNSDDESTERVPASTAVSETTNTVQTQEEEQTVDTWGSHLNKIVENKIDSAGPNFNASISKKIFCGSKLSKRYSRKSLSFSQKKSETSFDHSVLSQSTQSFVDVPVKDNELLSFEGIFKNDNVKVTTVTEKISSQPTNIVQSVLDNNYKSLKTVDAGWLERVRINSGVTFENSSASVLSDYHDESNMCLDYNSDDIIDNSDDDTSGHQVKKPKIDISYKNDVTTKETIKVKITKQDNFIFSGKEGGVNNSNQELFASDIITQNVSKFSDSQVINKSKGEESTNQTVESPIVTQDPYKFVDDIPNEVDLNRSPKKRTTKTSSNKKKINSIKKPDNSQKIRKSNRSTKSRASMAESHSEEDPFHSDNDSNDPEFSLSENKNKFTQLIIEHVIPSTTKKSKPRTKIVAQPKEIVNEEEENDKYELEYSIKPRVSAPRFKNLKKLLKSETSASTADPGGDSKENKSEIKDKRQQLLEKLEKKIDSGGLNDNFVTIDIRKKKYTRGKKNITFSKFKKQQWRNKKKALAGPNMDMGGCDGGMLTCYNCGGVGHFAQNCKKERGDGLLPLEADEEICPFPTLEEASQMAKESSLAIRKPNCGVNSQIETDADLEDDDSDDCIFDDGETEAMLAEALKIEENVAKLDLQFYLDYVIVVEPYFKTNDNGTVIDTPREVFSALEQFGYSSFRPGQEEAVMRILSGKSTLVTLSTGSGKSLIYQLPALLYSKREPCITLVVSPLVSLMEDQVVGIPKFLAAACLHTNQTKTQREKIMEAISSGQLDILLVSPEAVVAGEKQSGFGSLLRKLPPIAFACIDEAHCVSQWSHNFRPSYLLICRVLRERMGIKTILGLTATATRSTSDSIITHLQIPDGRDGIITDVPLPDNLLLSVSKDYQRDQALLALLDSERFANCKSIIIYCTRREECNRITSFLRTTFHDVTTVTNKKRKRISVQVEPYHAGLSASRRRTIQKAFMSGELRIVVATVAFGMGINKSDIRAVIHYNMPKNFESYVQEIGRAGRDGLPAHCHLFLGAKGNDENELRRHIYSNSIDRHVIRKLLQKIFLPCSCKGTCPKHEVAFSIEQTVRELDIPEENISTLLCYLELHEKKYVELLSPGYTVCKVISYGGPMQIRKASKECPPLAMALALQKNKVENEQNVLEFPVVDIAAAIGWDSGICKHKLKNLEWMTVNGMPKRSTLNVTFSNLGFRLLAPGNLDDEQLDEALDSLYEHVVNQEKTSLLQLHAVHQSLVEVAVPTYKSCLSAESTDGNVKLKAKIREYFESPNPLDSVTLGDNKIVDEEHVVNNIRGLISTYRDNNFTGRAIARIFHGIMSPNYPAVIWGRCKYWRCHINVDFHTICKLATREILSFR